MKFIKRISPTQYEIAQGFVPNMRVPGICYVNSALEGLLFDELKAYSSSGGQGGFLPAVKQMANVAAMPGIVQACLHQPSSEVLLFWCCHPTILFLEDTISTCHCSAEVHCAARHALRIWFRDRQRGSF